MSTIIGFNPSDEAVYRPTLRPGAWFIKDGSEEYCSLESNITLSVVSEDYQDNLVPIQLYTGQYEREHSDLHIVRKIIKAHAFRIVPWSRLWLAPSFSGCAYCIGKAWSPEGIIVIKTSSDIDTMLTIVFHELWHLLEWHLPAKLLEQLDTDLEKGPGYGKQYGAWSSEPSHYLGLSHERRARAFARFAMLQVEGIEIPHGNSFNNKGLQVLSDAWHGNLAGQALRIREQDKGGRNGYHE